jgi:hypothetical protein
VACQDVPSDCAAGRGGGLPLAGERSKRDPPGRRPLNSSPNPMSGLCISLQLFDSDIQALFPVDAFSDCVAGAGRLLTNKTSKNRTTKCNSEVY